MPHETTSLRKTIGILLAARVWQRQAAFETFAAVDLQVTA
jgi:hypothetical protein